MARRLDNDARPATAGATGGEVSRALELELRGVQKRYPGRRDAAVPDLSLTVPAGEVCVLVGPSGSGKTTAMRLINRMIPLSGGDILLGGRSILERDPTELRREIGYVIQQIGLFPHQTVQDNIATVPKLLGWPKNRIEARVRELLALISLEFDEVADRYPNQLSGGQRQRVGVARALAADPPLLLMDEPFGAIDPINRTILQDGFLALQAKVRKTVVFVTHDIDEAIKVGDRIAILRAGGALAQYATPAEILESPVDDFVAEFVGADRALKRLGLATLADVRLPPMNGDNPSGDVPVTMSVRDALAAVLAAGGQPLRVLGEDGEVRGLATLDAIGHVFDGSSNGLSQSNPAGAVAAEET
jgi:osmoprotectant transport system ATP-binding protein